MIPLRDVIPSRTRPGVTLTVIALNVIVYLFQATLSERTAELFCEIVNRWKECGGWMPDFS